MFSELAEPTDLSMWPFSYYVILSTQAPSPGSRGSFFTANHLTETDKQNKLTSTRPQRMLSAGKIKDSIKI